VSSRGEARWRTTGPLAHQTGASIYFSLKLAVSFDPSLAIIVIR
jgi:hypothetical protein